CWSPESVGSARLQPTCVKLPSFNFFFFSGPHDIDCSGIERGLDVRCVFLDHLDPGPTVFGDLVDVGAFHQPQTDVCMPQTVRGTRSPFAVEAETFLV